jgi:excisionase family DNA binding protein
MTAAHRITASTAEIVAAIAEFDVDISAVLAACAAKLAQVRPVPVHIDNGKPALMDAAELARAVSLPKSHVMTLARQRKIPSVRVGKYVRFNLAEVEAALHSR